LSQHWDKQAVVFLKDVKFDQLQALVDYMYRGEVNVSQDQLAAFLNTAEALKIKGLADGDRDRKNEKRILEKANRASSPSTVSRLAKRPRKVSKDGSMIQAPATATEKPQIPLLPSLVRIPHITSNDDSNDGGEESPESLDNDCHSNDNDMTENLHVELEDGEQFSMVEPKIEAEQEEAEYSGASGDEEDWSDSEYPSRMDASQGSIRPSFFFQSQVNLIFHFMNRIIFSR
jgi:BTB/POZ domain